MLTSEKIEELASRKGAKRMAVENFLGSIGDLSYNDAVANCMQDARDYRWSTETVGAIREGLALHFRKGLR